MRVALIDVRNFLYMSYYGSGRNGKIYPDLLQKVHAVASGLRTRHIVFVSDGCRPLWRQSDITESYKANRETNEKLRAIREEIQKEMPRAHQFLRMLGYPLLQVPHIEADDLIGILTTRITRAWKWHVFIVSNDRDYYSLLSPTVSVYKPTSLLNGGFTGYTEADFIRDKGIDPELWTHVKALSGDNSDNIKGLYRVGPVNAIKAVKLGVRANDETTLPEAYAAWAQQWDAALESYALVQVPRTIYDLPERFRQSADESMRQLIGYDKRRRCVDTQRARMHQLMTQSHEYRITGTDFKLHPDAVCDLV